MRDVSVHSRRIGREFGQLYTDYKYIYQYNTHL